MAGPLPGCLPGRLEIYGGSTGPARAGLVRLRSQRAGKCAPVHQNTLARNISGLGRAEERARRPELVRTAETPGGNRRNPFHLRLLDRNSLASGGSREIGLQALGFEGARKQEVDGDIRCRNRASNSGKKGGKPGAGPGGKSSPASGIFTDPDVMLTMRPNFRAAIESMTF